jgi:CBS-domain-containing membrane protein
MFCVTELLPHLRTAPHRQLPYRTPRQEEKPMQVKDRMTPNPVTVAADSSFENALHLMKEKKIRRLPSSP